MGFLLPTSQLLKKVIVETECSHCVGWAITILWRLLRHQGIFVTNVILKIPNDIKPLVLYLAIKLNFFDKNTSLHYRYATRFKGQHVFRADCSFGSVKVHGNKVIKKGGQRFTIQSGAIIKLEIFSLSVYLLYYCSSTFFLFILFLFYTFVLV